MTRPPARGLVVAALLPAVLVLAGCGDVGGPGDADPVRAGAESETSLEGWVGDGGDDLTQAEIDELVREAWQEGGDVPPLDDSDLCDPPGPDGAEEVEDTEELDMTLPIGTPLDEALAADGTTAVLVRADRTDDAAWTRVTELVLAGTDFGDGEPGPCGEPPELYQPAILTSDDPAWAGLTAEAAIADLPPTYGYLLLADGRSMREAAAGGEVTVLWVDLGPAAEGEPDLPRSFRSTVDVVAEVEANLAIANMGFFEYADSADPDGVFRGF
ncbi:DUF6924 domain-containing protein [Nocardioides zeae]|uniref:DUF6924 domain-containing protein n=1 Tax=Nocardioides zeae TaxID=1457234 RepID=A0AAJ1X281_9ACTN|nr:hypothetical protein [Nocardioides zeae]MDQ1103297.1 hypothetical protein [Nocardioides zeae]